jgi:hypothetical protein
MSVRNRETATLLRSFIAARKSWLSCLRNSTLNKKLLLVNYTGDELHWRFAKRARRAAKDNAVLN